MKYLREILPLDEVSRKTLFAYKKKAEDETYSGQEPRKLTNRLKGIDRAEVKLEKGRHKILDPGHFRGMTTTHKEETELDEAKRTPYKRKGSLRAQVKSQADVAKEKTERRKAMRGAKRETKETGEKVKFAKFKDWRSVRKSAREKVQEDLQELSLQRLGSYVDKAGAQDYDRDSTKHRQGINLALRKRGEHKHLAEIPPKVRASRDGKKK